MSHYGVCKRRERGLSTDQCAGGQGNTGNRGQGLYKSGTCIACVSDPKSVVTHARNVTPGGMV